MKGPLFYSKILLFGEYGIIQDSKGLSIPYNFYKGALKTDENPSVYVWNCAGAREYFASARYSYSEQFSRVYQKFIEKIRERRLDNNPRTTMVNYTERL